MRLVRQTEYRSHVLLLFEKRGHDGAGDSQHWLIISPDGVNVLGGPQPTEAAACVEVDRLLREKGRDRTSRPIGRRDAPAPSR
jgi:hypothetical protein